MFQFRSCGQASLEYLLLLAAFFAAFAVLLPVVQDSAQNFLFASDTSLAKRISEEASEQISLMEFLSDGSVKEMDYFPAKSISLYSRGSTLVVESNGKTFEVDCDSPQLMERTEFTKKFGLVFEKKDGKVTVSSKEILQ